MSLIVGEVSHISHIVVPLICFATIEIQQVVRVMQQFSFRQPVPVDTLNLYQFTNKI